ncbi:MAG TPA: TolC family protein [Bryobacteraceae bacterium]|nr:TolC family protein [Bryobacteraceae bacterium]
MRLKFLPVIAVTAAPLFAQTAPPSPDRPWSYSAAPRPHAGHATISSRPVLDPTVTYSLPDLIDIAERNNPETRAYWERAREAADALGVSRAALFPALAAVASSSMNQYSLFNGTFHHENTTLFPTLLTLSWTVLDFGTRGAAIDVARANLLAADFTFNDTHRKLIFQVAQAYYKLLDALSRQETAQAAFADARVLRDAIEAKLANGLATLPDALEARSAAAQAQYDLASIQGATQGAQGDLATLLGVSPVGSIHVRDASSLPSAEDFDTPVETIISRALAQRPDFLAQMARVNAADSSVRQARSQFDPVLSFSGNWGHSDAIGQQRGSPEVRSAIYPWQAQFSLVWTIFDGGARRNQLERARAGAQEARAEVAVARDRIEDEIWGAYVQLKTSREQQRAADALVQAAEQSWSASLEAFQAGVRTFIDVSSAQKNLARARSARVEARIKLLSSIANLSFRTGDSIPGTKH